ncbi:hypothetical protein ACIGB8_18565 [Promicromonospora sukumoe]|uniref:hypothetical protein n=1 Tax=Promicromonospora sukumoe TaxID=88382 RepID=UPI0037C55040
MGGMLGGTPAGEGGGRRPPRPFPFAPSSDASFVGAFTGVSEGAFDDAFEGAFRDAFGASPDVPSLMPFDIPS